jgi:hypothetical protein
MRVKTNLPFAVVVSICSFSDRSPIPRSPSWADEVDQVLHGAAEPVQSPHHDGVPGSCDLEH